MAEIRSDPMGVYFGMNADGVDSEITFTPTVPSFPGLPIVLSPTTKVTKVQPTINPGVKIKTGFEVSGDGTIKPVKENDYDLMKAAKPIGGKELKLGVESIEFGGVKFKAGVKIPYPKMENADEEDDQPYSYNPNVDKTPDGYAPMLNDRYINPYGW